ncbi:MULTISPECIES: hypothetical protein [Streptococcus]|jgi:hypothetical protein|uniref:Thoeris protein ThsB TIR-like domain-containing protein n=1 Tax=Streptococcus oralis TaxID=1303 RepID=A0A3R9LCV6_STROR|nr:MULTISPECIES: hypothetical protein [Streptococcus]MCY7013821.1 hypothetical protein [Streptococcus sanguinis]RSK07446.1 hypothetical protein D8804_09470 [Streptococcus oralis]
MKRIFISFAIEDENLRDFLRGQSRNTNSPFEFVDMSVKQPWDFQWKTKCRVRIKGCDGVISIITQNTKRASGQIWEMNCAKDEGIPLLAIYGNKNHIGATIPNDMGYITIVDWNWERISTWIKQL